MKIPKTLKTLQQEETHGKKTLKHKIRVREVPVHSPYALKTTEPYHRD